MKTNKKLYLLLIVILSLLSGNRTVRAQSPTPSVTTVTVTLVDENEQAFPDIPVLLLMFRYGESVDTIEAGDCITGDDGSCRIVVNDPPNVDGWMEGMVVIPKIGESYAGWRGSSKDIVIQLLPGNLMATREPFLHPAFDKQPETTDVPPGNVLTETPVNTVTPAVSATPLPSLTNTPLTVKPTRKDQHDTPAPDVSGSGEFPIGCLAGMTAGGVFLITGWLVYWLFIRKHEDVEL